MNVGVHWHDIVGGKRNDVIMCGVNVVEDVKCGLHVNGHRITGVG